jgi:hypothetical protein
MESMQAKPTRLDNQKGEVNEIDNMGFRTIYGFLLKNNCHLFSSCFQVASKLFFLQLLAPKFLALPQ